MKANTFRKSKTAKAAKPAPAPKPAQTDLERAESQARAQLHSILVMVDALTKADDGDDETARDEARTTINEGALSVEVRSGWHTPGENSSPSEFSILLCTGGPAVRLIGELNEYGEAESARMEFQDWFTPWVELRETTEAERAAMLVYAQTFYFGE